MRKTTLLAVLFLPLLLAGAYFLPPIRWRVDEAVLRLRYQLNPPEQVVFQPAQAAALPTPLAVTTVQPSSPPPTEPSPALTSPGPTATPPQTATAVPTPTPLPEQVSLEGVRYIDQHGRWNYCAPANLAMALSYWGWPGGRDDTGPILKPDEKDKNVMPYELADYVTAQTGLKAALRMGGDLETLKRFLAAGYPPLIEKGASLTDLTGVKSWMGHYAVVTGYDEVAQRFITQDSFIKADFEVSFDDLLHGWRAFNYTYLIVYPPEQEAEVLALLGPDADETENYRRAAEKASVEVTALTGLDQYFAWFNRGTSLMQLQDYVGAAAAYDEAFALYPTLPQAGRPWRMLWYQTGPYFAYYHAQRYWDVINLADATLEAMQSDKNLEETYHWRAMAKAALGDTAGAAEDFALALKYHPGFPPTLYQIQQLGIQVD